MMVRKSATEEQSAPEKKLPENVGRWRSSPKDAKEMEDRKKKP